MKGRIRLQTTAAMGLNAVREEQVEAREVYGNEKGRSQNFLSTGIRGLIPKLNDR